MTNLLVCPRASYETVAVEAPMLRFSPDACELYEGLMHGNTVPVFGYN